MVAAQQPVQPEKDEEEQQLSDQQENKLDQLSVEQQPRERRVSFGRVETRNGDGTDEPLSLATDSDDEEEEDDGDYNTCERVRLVEISRDRISKDTDTSESTSFEAQQTEPDDYNNDDQDHRDVNNSFRKLRSCRGTYY